MSIIEHAPAASFDESCRIRDRFTVDPEFETRLAFPCCVCIHRHGTDRDEPCIKCQHNLSAEP
jgi:hypothetical protein